MRFFTRTSDHEPQSPSRSPPRSRSRSQPTAQLVSASKHSRSRSTSTARPAQPLSSSTPNSRFRSRTRSTSTAQPTQSLPPSPSHPAILSRAPTFKPVETATPTTSIENPSFLATNPIYATTATFKTALPSLLSTISSPVSEKTGINEVDEKTIEAQLEKYSPGYVKVPDISTIDGYREMVRKMYLDNILWATATLQKHLWVAGSEKGVFKDLCTEQRREIIHEDLMRYTKAVKAYEYWRTFSIQGLEHAMPSKYNTYGRALAILECAAKNKSDLDTMTMIEVASAKLFNDFSGLSRVSSNKEVRNKESPKQRERGPLNRIAIVTFVGLALIVHVLLAMLLESRKLKAVISTGVSTLLTGLTLAAWQSRPNQKGVRFRWDELLKHRVLR